MTVTPGSILSVTPAAIWIRPVTMYGDWRPAMSVRAINPTDGSDDVRRITSTRGGTRDPVAGQDFTRQTSDIDVAVLGSVEL